MVKGIAPSFNTSQTVLRSYFSLTQRKQAQCMNKRITQIIKCWECWNSPLITSLRGKNICRLSFNDGSVTLKIKTIINLYLETRGVLQQKMPGTSKDLKQTILEMSRKCSNVLDHLYLLRETCVSSIVKQNMSYAIWHNETRQRKNIYHVGFYQSPHQQH